SSESLSRKAPVTPAAFASATSSAFAARIAEPCSRVAAAIPARARFFCSAEASARIRLAARARSPISRITPEMSPVPSILLSGAVIAENRKNPCSSAVSYHVRHVAARWGRRAHGRFAIGDIVDKYVGHATDQLTYTLKCQGDDVAGGCHGVRFGPSSQSVSCGH